MGDRHSFSHSANHHSFNLQLKQSLRQTLIHLPVQADTVHGSTGRPWYPPSPPQMQTHTYQPSVKEFYILSCGLWLHHRLRHPHPSTKGTDRTWCSSKIIGTLNWSSIRSIFAKISRLPKWHRGTGSFTSENTNRLVITRHSFSNFACVN